jgi:hypothetical protein
VVALTIFVSSFLLKKVCWGSTNHFCFKFLAQKGLLGVALTVFVSSFLLKKVFCSILKLFQRPMVFL